MDERKTDTHHAPSLLRERSECLGGWPAKLGEWGHTLGQADETPPPFGRTLPALRGEGWERALQLCPRPRSPTVQRLRKCVEEEIAALDVTR